MTVTPICCRRQCGPLIPLAVNGNYRGDGKTFVFFNLTGSQTCGIRVVDVLRGNLEGLIGRDDAVELNPNADSMRLRIELHDYVPFVRKMNTPANVLTMERLVRGVCKQVANFVAGVQAGGEAVPGLGLGVGIEQLVLVSIKRVTVGSWVPCIRVVYGDNQNSA